MDGEDETEFKYLKYFDVFAKIIFFKSLNDEFTSKWDISAEVQLNPKNTPNNEFNNFWDTYYFLSYMSNCFFFYSPTAMIKVENGAWLMKPNANQLFDPFDFKTN